MMGVVPGRLDERGERYGGWVFAAIGVVGLAICTSFAAGQETAAHWPLTAVLLGVAVAWLALLVPLFPRRHRHPWLAIGYFGVFLLTAGLLVARDDAFTAFTSIGYPIAFALFPARWSVFAVAATAVTPLTAKGIWHPDTQTAPWILLVSVAGPMLYAAWFAGQESEKRRRANASLAEANARLETALEENAGLHAQLLTQAREAGVLDERQRMAREIHDTLAQGLTGIVTQLQAADRADGDERERHLAHVRSLAKESLSEARRSVQALRPEPLASSRLPEAMEQLAQRFADVSGAEVHTETTGDVRPLLPELEVTLYRVAQEALANAEKHAGATRVGLTLAYADDVVMLDVRDDGVGFRPEKPVQRPDGSGFGLQSMRQRVQRVAGTLAVESSPGEGTAINAQVPAIPAESPEAR